MRCLFKTGARESADQHDDLKPNGNKFKFIFIFYLNTIGHNERGTIFASKNAHYCWAKKFTRRRRSKGKKYFKFIFYIQLVLWHFLRFSSKSNKTMIIINSRQSVADKICCTILHCHQDAIRFHPRIKSFQIQNKFNRN